MQPSFDGERIFFRSHAGHVCLLAACAWALLLAGCGHQAKNDNFATATSRQEEAAAEVASSPPIEGTPASGKDQAPAAAEKKAAATAGAADPANDAVRRPATMAEAAQVLDLQTFPRLEDASEGGSRTMAHLSYQAPGEVKKAYEFQRKHLAERKWKELSAPQVSDQYASAQFGKDGFLLSLSVFPGGKSGEVSIMLLNHGNVNRRKLPVPSGAKLRHDFPAVTSFITDAGAEETAAALRKLLLDDGWQPYGSAGDSMIFKQNAIRLNVRVLSPPAEPGKTVIDFTSEQLSADLPAPPDAEHIHYADQNKRLDLEAQGTPQDAVAYYQKALAPAGWQSTMEEPIKDGFEAFMIFRNPVKDMLTLTLRDLQENKTRVTLEHQSAAEVAETERKIDAEIAARKKKEDEEKSKSKPKAFLALPEDADQVQAKPAEIEFQVVSGKGKSAATAIAKQLEADGWKAEKPDGDSMAGRMTYKKDAHTIHIDYVDPGIIPAEITISASGVVLEKLEKKE